MRASDSSRDGYVDQEELGSGFWRLLIGLMIAVCVGALLVFALISAAWYRWGALGALVFGSSLTLGLAWLYDRREAKRC